MQAINTGRAGVLTQAAAVLLGLLAAASEVCAFGMEDVIARAQQLARKPYRPPAATPQFMREMGYDQYRGMRYRTEHNLWREEQSTFEASLVMPGSVYARIVPINEVTGSTVRRLTFDVEHFEFDEPALQARIPRDLGFAGFELSYPLADATGREKFVVFAGASYFRAVPIGGQWGLSVRGASIDTGLPTGEEFPDFVEFWLLRPEPSARTLTVFALLDSPRLTGAYQFLISPGEQTHIDVRSVLFARARIQQLGVAPLTSMYFYGENTGRPAAAWRPEVHDSDGLLVHAANREWIWRPLSNPADLSIERFTAGDVFALLQRDTNFASYEDSEANYHRRPSAVVHLQRGFERGQVVLVQIPTRNEYLDNVVAFWSPSRPVRAGATLDLHYRLTFGSSAVAGASLGQVVNTFVGRDIIDASAGAGQHRFTVDFAGAQLDGLPADAPLAVRVTPAANTEILEQRVERIADTGYWRVSILARVAAEESASLRATLTMHGKRVSETWSYVGPREARTADAPASSE